MTITKYIGMDVHKESISIAVMNSAGKFVMECVIETNGSMLLQFIDGLRGDVRITFEEGTWAAWLYDLLKPHVSEVVVCNPRKNALLKDGSKSDRIDARKLAELLRGNHLKPVYHGEQGLRTLKELARSYLNISKDVTRVMNRLKALYRSWGVACAGTQVYAPRHRSEWLGRTSEAGVRRRAEHCYQQLHVLRLLRQQVRRDLFAAMPRSLQAPPQPLQHRAEKLPKPPFKRQSHPVRGWPARWNPVLTQHEDAREDGVKAGPTASKYTGPGGREMQHRPRRTYRPFGGGGICLNRVQKYL
jgi:hypothetical protein